MNERNGQLSSLPYLNDTTSIISVIKFALLLFEARQEKRKICLLTKIFCLILTLPSASSLNAENGPHWIYVVRAAKCTTKFSLLDFPASRRLSKLKLIIDELIAVIRKFNCFHLMMIYSVTNINERLIVSQRWFCLVGLVWSSCNTAAMTEYSLI